MKRFMKSSIAVFALSLILIATFGTKALAYSEIPDCFDFTETVLKMDAGTTKQIPIMAYYNYTYYLGPHTSSGTYMECSYKTGYQYVTLHIGADETEKNIFYHFYVDDDRMPTSEKHDCIEVYVQNINPAAAAAADAKEAAISGLKNYSGNNAEFNALYYYSNYKDLQDAFGTNPDLLLAHYNQFGKNEGRIANKLK
ncbi:hypothetical protein [Butyrivibrio sp. WCD2001]|uniref:hypothetical protein n=2 Tax=unclassified Butyrivibrio TaxID=2639466 RepID=UPI0003B5447A|nr:hypothetical protein [Butyrivibrio sp. WCD2001]